MKVKKNSIYLLLIALGLATSSCKEDNHSNTSISLKKFTDKMVFKNKGTVSKDMKFERIAINGYYTESNEFYRRFDGPEYLFEIKDTLKVETPSGMRSAIPLGGFGAGSVELRADGSFQDWDIFNNSPATGNRKTQLNNAFMGLWVKEKNKEVVATTLRTHPPKGLPAIDQIEYSGSFPVSKLTLTDSKLPVEAKLYAYSEYKIRDPKASATPCALFSIELHNPNETSAQTSFLFNLPNHIKGNFKVENGLVLTKDGTEPASGNMTLAANGADKVTYAVADDLNVLWNTFNENGAFNTPDKTSGAYGALSAQANLKPGETRTITIALGWYFPNRPISVEIVGNYYTELFDNSTDVVNKALNRLPKTWENILDWNAICFDNTLPEWLQDAMVNSTATITKTSFWTKDNRFRQWESFACPNINPIHIDFSRTLPYDLFFPELKKGIISAHGNAQRENGYIPEKLWTRRTKDKLDHPSPGRVLGDCNPSFILSVYATYKWDNDKAFVDSMWPHVKRAALWQIERSKSLGLPNRLAATYDLSGFGRKDLVSYNAFMHLAALKATMELGKIYGDDELVTLCKDNITTAQKTLKEKFWTGKYFRNWWNVKKQNNDDLHVDTQFAQVWSYMLGLGELMDSTLLKSHLASEISVGETPYGLKVLPHSYKYKDHSASGVNNTIWQAGSIHWTILNLYLGMEPNQSMEQAKKVIEHWSTNINDQWDYADLTSASTGYPHTNSHYGRQLMLWGIPMALSGQQYNASEGVLAFSPKLEPPYRLPFFTAHASGIIDASIGEPILLKLTSGELKLDKLMVNGQILTENVSLKAGEELILDQG
ncbi:hypothetical protein AXE80_02935 [Wenyingzhuangia fucanilytica]|uniref:Glycosyl-hydrolase family 116 catalytic region domain-containing protein n=1 Tax=Wenyingzhuangia fucanilytica TaxID=1790137 RepID=A0A1B1Y3F8_9FLAO|nr:GH116 family glycosyl-hydrolase [Wenyingzhuangia fucanilytica]ANW95304.1 hypothetical protein AXE80_02935 [Wenyingzhuangia fucanilytica]